MDARRSYTADDDRVVVTRQQFFNNRNQGRQAPIRVSEHWSPGEPPTPNVPLSSLDAVATREAIGNGLVRFTEEVEGKMRIARQCNLQRSSFSFSARFRSGSTLLSLQRC